MNVHRGRVVGLSHAEDKTYVAKVQVLDDGGQVTGAEFALARDACYKADFKPWHPEPVLETPGEDGLPGVNEVIVFTLKDGRHIERWAYEQSWKIAEACKYNAPRYRLVRLRDNEVQGVLWIVDPTRKTPAWQQVFHMSTERLQRLDGEDEISQTYQNDDPNGLRFQVWQGGCWEFTDDIRAPYQVVAGHFTN